ncbi:MAG: tRNA preQ1(34) S-adenosylmethionine ribosyltransferase-isomerase QueA [Pirellulales bacterium]|nr:tRNA preQ1(34) S-adenosylmethionine ribosyltransferase-isomerase QueA [Pirellulales bacterium]
MSSTGLFDYELPKELIAQHPLANRGDARLLVVERSTGQLRHAHIRDLPDLLQSGDQLVTNDSRVLPARFFGTRVATGGRVELLFLGSDETGLWQVLVKARGNLQPKEVIQLQDLQARETLKLWLLEKAADGIWTAYVESNEPPPVILERIGRMPLPPYIRDGMETEEDRDRYQTVYAKVPGSVAAPTAGLHFTPEILQKLADRGIPRHSVTLHVGLGTFKPIQTTDLDEHPMHAEWAKLGGATAGALQAAKQAGQRIVAVGTTTTRVLETVAAEYHGALRSWSGATQLFIRPPYTFRAVDVLLTNFHLPRTTLLLLVSAFAGTELMRSAYQVAVREQYRFYSYGDAMLIV